MTFENISPQAAYQKTKEGYVYLDVRTIEEFREGHAKGAINIPIFIAAPGGRALNPNFLALVTEKFPKETKLVLGCRSGGRSAKACELLEQIGFTTLCNINGGFIGSEESPGWQVLGLPCE